MPTTTDAELSLINDAEFLDELGQFEARVQLSESVESPIRHDATFDGLDRDLPMDLDAPQSAAPLYDREPMANPYDDPPDASSHTSARAEASVPFFAAALVLVACLTAGAATAVFVFHDRLTRITATTANR
jgi:hypothetical protein